MRLNNGFEIPQIGVGHLRQTLLMLLLCGVCFACNVPQQDEKKTDLTNENKNMTNVELREKLALALEDMKAKAIEMGIEGVATASVLNSGDTVDWIGEMKVVGSYCNWKDGYNLVAVAWSKCGEVIATHADSGDPNHQTITGELGYAGGAYDEYEGCKLAFAFSGATSEEDLVVAKYGIEKMKGYITDRTIGIYPGSSWTIVDSEDVLGVNLNIKPKR